MPACLQGGAGHVVPRRVGRHGGLRCSPRGGRPSLGRFRRPPSAPAGWPNGRTARMMRKDGCSKRRRVVLAFAAIWPSGCAAGFLTSVGSGPVRPSPSRAACSRGRRPRHVTENTVLRGGERRALRRRRCRAVAGHQRGLVGPKPACGGAAAAGAPAARGRFLPAPAGLGARPAGCHHLQIGSSRGGCSGRESRHASMIGWSVPLGQNLGAPISSRQAAFQ